MRILLYALLLLTAFHCNQPDPGQLAEDAKPLPSDYFYRQRAFPDGRIHQQAYQDAIAQYQQAVAAKSSAEDWTQVGPLNVGGRISALAVRQTTTNEFIYAGAASGGIFRSANGGQEWVPIFDQQLALSIGCITLDPHNESSLYVGTGEPNAGGGSIAYEGTGIYHSNDDGDTWVSLGLANTGSIARIAIDPIDPDRIFAAAMGTLYEDSSDRGIYRSLDGGQTWENVLFVNARTGGLNVAIHPNDPQIVYAVLWERYRRPNERNYSGPGSGIYRSDDGGATWSEIDNGLPTGDLNRIGFAMASSNPSRLYASVAHFGGSLAGIFTSSNGGESWIPLTTASLTTVGFEWWFNELVVDPEDESQLWRLGFNVNKLSLGDNGWTDVFPGVHVDQHALWIDPTNTNRVLLGNDGGVFESLDGGASYDHFINLPITQFYAIEVSELDTDRRFGGSQDNGTQRTLNGGDTDWELIFGGDGFRVLVDPTNQNFVYAESQFGGIGRSINGGSSFLDGTNGISEGFSNWNTPIVFDPSNPATLYTGTDRVYRSDNRAVLWEAISPSLIGPNPVSGNLVFNTITAIGISPVDQNIIWAGLDNGRLWITEDEGFNWEDVSAALPNRWVTSVTPHPELANTAYATLSGFRWNETTAHVYRTDDGGQTWAGLEGNLPDVPVNELIIDSATLDLIIATDVGVYRSTDDGVSWSVLGSGLPAVVVSDLRFHAGERMLYAGTYGRSMFRIQLDEVSATNKPTSGLTHFNLAPNPARGWTHLKLNLTQSAQITPRLRDAAGKMIKQYPTVTLPVGANAQLLSLEGLPRGIYFVEILAADGSKQVQRLVVETAK
ncbi:MAG: T9SS type A sorting domain-containing protein [Bacteroidota bacterium]